MNLRMELREIVSKDLFSIVKSESQCIDLLMFQLYVLIVTHFQLDLFIPIVFGLEDAVGLSSLKNSDSFCYRIFCD